MKKMLSLLSVLVLAACDRPTSTAYLTCGLDKNWQRDDVEYVMDADGRFAHLYSTEIDVKVVTYEDYATITFDKITTRFEKVQEYKFGDEFGDVILIYKGNFPGSERMALLSVFANITNKQISHYHIKFIGKKVENSTFNHSCYTKENRGRSANVPFHHNYKMPNRTEKCITEIVNKVFCRNEECTKLYIYEEEKEAELSQQEALALSSNWNYSNMKYYRNDGKLEKHEKDACEVLDRINKFIYDNNLDSHQYKAIQKAITDVCGFDCRTTVLATGEMGDFLIKVPETEELRKIVNQNKNTKFLSVFNPNSYAKDGYCLVNIVPFSTMEQMGMPNNNCNYRIYCGAPEYMNYDEFYAVEVCD